MKELDKVEGIERYRISSIEPNLLTEEIIWWMSQSKKFLPHLHIPLQSGSDAVLVRMKRRYNRELFRRRIETIRKYMSDAFIGVDVIAGFPGETEDEFLDTFNFLERIKPSFLHIFPYSKRINTPAAEFEHQVKDSDKTDRVNRLTELSDKLHLEFAEANKGRVEQVLFESTQKGGKMFGYTRNYIRVERPYKREMIGEIVEVTI